MVLLALLAVCFFNGFRIGALCAQNFELLPILKNTPEGQLLHNTIYAGVWSKYALVKATRTPRKGKPNE